MLNNQTSCYIPNVTRNDNKLFYSRQPQNQQHSSLNCSRGNSKNCGSLRFQRLQKSRRRSTFRKVNQYSFGREGFSRCNQGGGMRLSSEFVVVFCFVIFCVWYKPDQIGKASTCLINTSTQPYTRPGSACGIHMRNQYAFVSMIEWLGEILIALLGPVNIYHASIFAVLTTFLYFY